MSNNKDHLVGQLTTIDQTQGSPGSKRNNNESVHCREEGCIGKYTPRGLRDFPRAGILHPEAQEIARGQSRGPMGAKSLPEGNLEGRGECIFRYIPTRGSVRTFFHSLQGGIRSYTIRLQVCLVTTSVLLSRPGAPGYPCVCG